MADNKPELQRGLEARHIELIALGGTIGVGLFMGAASTLKWAGPSVLLAYIIAGLFVFFIMRSMGEMLFLEPVTGSFAVYAHRYMSPFFGYLTAWSYWFMWMRYFCHSCTRPSVRHRCLDNHHSYCRYRPRRECRNPVEYSS